MISGSETIEDAPTATPGGHRDFAGGKDRMRHREIRSVAMVSAHTSPLDPPGSADAGGLNVYLDQVVRHLAARGIQVAVFAPPPTVCPDRSASAAYPPLDALDGVRLYEVPRPTAATGHHGIAAPADIPWRERIFADSALPGFDVVHAHYWMSGTLAMQLAAAKDIPFVHTMHTLAKVKNAALATGDLPEPPARIAAENAIVRHAHALIANTTLECRQLRELYSADPQRIHVVHPGVDTQLFHPGGTTAAQRSQAQSAARAQLRLDPQAQLIVFAGRIQPMKAPDVLIRAMAELLRADPQRPVQACILGGLSGNGIAVGYDMAALIRSLGLGRHVQLLPAVDRGTLVQWYRAADVVAVPSRSESFGLVALEAAACGTPVVAAGVSGLRIAVADGRSGVLVDSHDPVRWAQALAAMLDDPQQRERFSEDAVQHAHEFSWDVTATGLLEAYHAAQDCCQGVPATVGCR